MAFASRLPAVSRGSARFRLLLPRTRGRPALDRRRDRKFFLLEDLNQAVDELLTKLITGPSVH
jgi:hypothetical protein